MFGLLGVGLRGVSTAPRVPCVIYRGSLYVLMHVPRLAVP